MLKEYKTVLVPAVAEYIEKKSKFIAAIAPAETEEEAENFIEAVKSKYRDATHNVYAYYIMLSVPTQKSSDDGEPSGTAGLPVIETIKKAGIINVVVVVTRYFGGTLLGAAGLVRAYGKSAQMAVERAEVVCRRLCDEAYVTADYKQLGRIQNLLLGAKFIIQKIEYEENVKIVVSVDVDRKDEFITLVEEASNGLADITFGVRGYVTFKP